MDPYDKIYILRKLREAFDILEEITELVEAIDEQDNPRED